MRLTEGDGYTHASSLGECSRAQVAKGRRRISGERESISVRAWI